MVFVFDRYRDGRLMAEGAKITKATTEEEALEKAKKLFSPYHNNTFVLRKTEGTKS